MAPSYQGFVKKNINLVGGSSPQEKMSNVAKLWREQKGGVWKEAETPRATIYLPQPHETPVVGKHRRNTKSVREKKCGVWQGAKTPKTSFCLPQPHETPVVGKHRIPPPIYELEEVPERKRGVKPHKSKNSSR